MVQYLGKKVSEPTFAFMKTRENEREFSLKEGGWEIEISSTSSDLMLVSILMWIMYLAIYLGVAELPTISILVDLKSS